MSVTQAAKLMDEVDRLNEQVATLEAALRNARFNLDYWLRTYRRHSGFLNATQLSERECLVQALDTIDAALVRRG